MDVFEIVSSRCLKLDGFQDIGKFEVTSPNGERYFVTCQPGHSISSLEWAGSEPNLQPFVVRKVAQPVAFEGRTKRSSAA